MAPPWGRVDERSLSRAEGVLCHVAQKQWGPSLSLWLNQWPTFVKHHIFVPRISSSSSSAAVLQSLYLKPLVNTTSNPQHNKFSFKFQLLQLIVIKSQPKFDLCVGFVHIYIYIYRHGHGSQGNPNNKEQFEASAMDTVFKAHKRAEGTALHRMEMQCDASVLA